MGEPIRLRVASSEETIRIGALGGNMTIDAFSPRVSFEKVEGGTRMDVTDIEGTKSTVIYDGNAGQMDDVPTAGSTNVVASGGVKAAIDDAVAAKQDVLTFDAVPTLNSNNPVKSGGVRSLIDAVANGIPRSVSDLVDDSGHYTKPPNGIPASDLAYGVIPDVSGKQDALTFDSTPTLDSHNPVSSNGIKRALDTAYNQITGETDLKLLVKADKVEECTDGNLAALDETGNLTDSGAKASDFLTRAEYTPVTVDSDLLSTSANPVQNKAIFAEVQDIKDLIFSSGFVPVADPTTWELGGWYSANGAGSGVTNRIRTTQASQVDSLDYYIMADDGALFFPLFYNGSTYIQREKYPWSSICSIADAAPEGATGFRLTVRSRPITDLDGKVAETAAKIHFFKGRKIDKVINPTAGNLAALDSTGGLVDSGCKASDFLTSAPVTDVQVNGTSIVSSGVADVPVASTSAVGVVKVGAGLTINSSSDLLVDYANASESKAGSNYRKPITPYSQHNAAFYGLAKAAGDSTQASSSNAVGKYTAGAMDKILAMLGVSDLIAPREASAVASKAYAVGDAFIYNGKLYKATAAISSGGAIVPGTNCTTTYLVDLI